VFIIEKSKVRISLKEVFETIENFRLQQFLVPWNSSSRICEDFPALSYTFAL